MKTVYTQADKPIIMRSISATRSCRKSVFSRSYSAKNLPPSFKVAIIGAGPAGFYSAYQLLKKLPEAEVDLYESLPVPYGSFRFGVVPSPNSLRVSNRVM